MAELVDAADLIRLSLGKEIDQVIVSIFRKTWIVENTSGNPEPNFVYEIGAETRRKLSQRKNSLFSAIVPFHHCKVVIGSNGSNRRKSE